eukprot:g79977.t1
MLKKRTPFPILLDLGRIGNGTCTIYNYFLLIQTLHEFLQSCLSVLTKIHAEFSPQSILCQKKEFHSRSFWTLEGSGMSLYQKEVIIDRASTIPGPCKDHLISCFANFRTICDRWYAQVTYRKELANHSQKLAGGKSFSLSTDPQRSCRLIVWRFHLQCLPSMIWAKGTGMSWSAASTTRGINMEYYRRIKGSPGTTAWATKRVCIWAAKGYFEFTSGKDWEDCLLFKFTTDDNKSREGALALDVRLLKYNRFELKGDTQVETSEGDPCAPGLFISFPAGWRKKTPAQINRGSKRFIFAARNVDTDGDGDKSPLNFEKDVKPAFLPWVGNPTHPPLLGVWRKKELLLLLEANKRKRTGSGPEPRSSGRPKKLKFDTLKVEEDAEDSEDAEVAEQDDPPTSSSKGKKKSTSKGARTYLIQGIPFLVGQGPLALGAVPTAAAAGAGQRAPGRSPATVRTNGSSVLFIMTSWSSQENRQPGAGHDCRLATSTSSPSRKCGLPGWHAAASSAGCSCSNRGWRGAASDGSSRRRRLRGSSRGTAGGRLVTEMLGGIGGAGIDGPPPESGQEVR